MDQHITEGRRKVHLLLLRTSPALKEALEQAATAHGRSLTQEIESRLERLFLLEELQGGAHTATLLHHLRDQIAIAELGSAARWWDDRVAWSETRQIVEKALLTQAPDPFSANGMGHVVDRGAKVTITVRCTTELKGQLDEAAKAGGRSLNKETEVRLYRSVASEHLKLCERTSAFLNLLGALLRECDATSGLRWLETPSSRTTAIQLVRTEFHKRRPPLLRKPSNG